MSDAAILCVDDEAVVIAALKSQLQRLFGRQYLYEFAQSAEEAWEIISELEEESIKILIIVSDWLMPGCLTQVGERLETSSNEGERVR